MCILSNILCILFPFFLIPLPGVRGDPDFDDPGLNSALQSVSEVVRGFVDNNPSAWAPVICQVNGGSLLGLSSVNYDKLLHVNFYSVLKL